MKFPFALLLSLIVAGCGSVPDPTLRSDVIYYENTPDGQKAVAETLALYRGRQMAMIAERSLSEMIPPVPVARPAPEYPVEMRALDLQGTVTVDFIVDEFGNVYDAVVVHTTHPGFNAPAIDAVLKWTFKPATRDGVNVRTRLRIPISFTVPR